MQLRQLLNWAAPRPAGTRASINITLEPATLVADGGGLQFTNGFYRCTWMGLGKQTCAACPRQGGIQAALALAPTAAAPTPPSPAGRDGESGGIYVFGPTLRIRAGEPYWIYLANQMYIGPNSTQASHILWPVLRAAQPQSCCLLPVLAADYVMSSCSGFAVVPGVNHLLFGPRAVSSRIRTLQGAANSFRDPTYTNLHTHGLHDSPGGQSTPLHPAALEVIRIGWVGRWHRLPSAMAAPNPRPPACLLVLKSGCTPAPMLRRRLFSGHSRGVPGWAAAAARCNSTALELLQPPLPPPPLSPPASPITNQPHLPPTHAPPGSDNIFVSVPGKMRPDDEPARLAMNSSTPPDHLPGLHCETRLPRGDLQAAEGCRPSGAEVATVCAGGVHMLGTRLWGSASAYPSALQLRAHCTTPADPHHTGYHPHYHGSSMLQTSTANGLIIVEGESKGLRVCHLPAAPLCFLAQLP